MGAWGEAPARLAEPRDGRVRPEAHLQLGPAAYNTSQAQALVTLLPDREVSTTIGTPAEGPDYWYSGSGDDVDSSMLTPLPAEATTLAAKVTYDVEVDWDYAYVVYSTDGGETFTSIPTNRSTTTNPNGQNFSSGITGSTADQWVDLTANLTGVPAGAQVGFRLSRRKVDRAAAVPPP